MVSYISEFELVVPIKNFPNLTHIIPHFHIKYLPRLREKSRMSYVSGLPYKKSIKLGRGAVPIFPI